MKHIDISQYYDDPVPDPYPEIEEEVFELYQAQGIIPEDLVPDEATAYREWLKKQEKPCP